MEMLSPSGDASIYTSNSTRHVSSSKKCHVTKHVAFTKGGWSSDSVFRKHYNPLIKSASVPVSHVNGISGNLRNLH